MKNKMESKMAEFSKAVNVKMDVAVKETDKTASLLQEITSHTALENEKVWQALSKLIETIATLSAQNETLWPALAQLDVGVAQSLTKEREENNLAITNIDAFVVNMERRVESNTMELQTLSEMISRQTLLVSRNAKVIAEVKSESKAPELFWALSDMDERCNVRMGYIEEAMERLKAGIVEGLVLNWKTIRRPTPIVISDTTYASHNAIPPNLHRARLVRFFGKHNPAKLPEVDVILDASNGLGWNGREEEMVQKLVEEYGPEPPY